MENTPCTALNFFQSVDIIQCFLMPVINKITCKKYYIRVLLVNDFDSPGKRFST